MHGKVYQGLLHFLCQGLLESIAIHGYGHLDPGLGIAHRLIGQYLVLEIGDVFFESRD